jgi:hypothetical protein
VAQDANIDVEQPRRRGRCHGNSRQCPA